MDFWDIEGSPATLEVIDTGLQHAAGFITLKETVMEKQLTEKEILALRNAAKLAASLPEINNELEAMDKTVMGNAFNDIRKGSLTPERAVAYLMELYANNRLRKRMEQSASEAANVTETRSNG